MAEIIIAPFAETTLQSLIEILYEKAYFGFKESCSDDAGKIYDFCHSLPYHHHRKTKDAKYGEWYCKYTHIRKTY